jgi:hypothetical protein
MIKYILFAVGLTILSGCTTVPVTAKFPEPPGKIAMAPCPGLQKLADEVKLSEVGKTVAANYTVYYECAIRNDAWVEWYNVQKKIFEGAGK